MHDNPGDIGFNANDLLDKEKKNGTGDALEKDAENRKMAKEKEAEDLEGKDNKDKKPIGRPKKDPSKLLSNQVSVKFSDEELAWLRSQAGSDDAPLARIIRRLALATFRPS